MHEKSAIVRRERNESHAQKTSVQSFVFLLSLNVSVCVCMLTCEFFKCACNVVLVCLRSIVYWGCQSKSGSEEFWGPCSESVSLGDRQHSISFNASNLKLRSLVTGFMIMLMNWTTPLQYLRASFYNAHGHRCTSRLRAICETVREANRLAVQGLPSVLVIVPLHAVPAQVIWSPRWLLVTWKRASMDTSTLTKETAASAEGKGSPVALHGRRSAHCTVTPRLFCLRSCTRLRLILAVGAGLGSDH